jgi:hypothetical protein
VLRSSLPRPTVYLGLAGLFPQAACLLLALMSGSYQLEARTAGCFYAAIILSFLGGMWWMAGLMSCERHYGVYLFAVVPSIAGWIALLPWVIGWAWPGPSLAFLGVLLLLRPLADRAIARRLAPPPGWLQLRLALASGLAPLTLAIAAL